jgi:amino acid permease
LWFGQALYPTFIAEMRRPQDFPKALAALTILQLILFTVTAAVGYHFMGQYATAP